MLTKVYTRLVDGIKRFKPIVIKAREKDVNESDTVTIITDILADIFGYDKYTEITSEFAIKKTYCDLAIKIDGTSLPLSGWFIKSILVNRLLLILFTNSVLDSVRKMVEKISPKTKCSNDEIYRIINDEIIKRDVMDDEKTPIAKKFINKELQKTKKGDKIDV